MHYPHCFHLTKNLLNLSNLIAASSSLQELASISLIISSEVFHYLPELLYPLGVGLTVVYEAIPEDKVDDGVALVQQGLVTEPASGGGVEGAVQGSHVVEDQDDGGYID